MPASLFEPFALGGLSLDNRVVVAPMCQYSATDGTPGEWHVMHLGSLAISGASLVIVEATGVEPEGRITPSCTGLYSDENEEAFGRILAFCRSIAPARLGIQLSHAGRKGSTVAPWEGGGPIEGPQAWVPDAPSAIPYLESWTPPNALDEDGLARIRTAFADAAKRAARVGFEYLELHCAHGYLLHQFLSPLTNARNDEWGGPLENRMRFPLACFEAVREAFPDDLPVTVRVSATDWIPGGWDLEQSIAFAEALKARGCAGVHVTSGGLRQDQKIRTGPGYQLAFSSEIRRAADIPTIAVGQITEPVQAETIVRTGQADLVALARTMLWDPRWVWKAAVALGEETTLPAPYARAHPAVRARPFVKR
jgi:2,4-dienoyl-CoA reductase-like NADH-dependent reductase (Old Yellow Enzyme family)